MALWNWLAKARSLALSDWLALLEAWLALLAFSMLLRWWSFSRLEQSGFCPHPETSENLPLARHLHVLTGWAARLHLLPMTCLTQSLTLRWMLKRRGAASSLKIGAVKTESKFQAHAWLEMAGETVGEMQDVQGLFRPLAHRL